MYKIEPFIEHLHASIKACRYCIVTVKSNQWCNLIETLKVSLPTQYFLTAWLEIYDSAGSSNMPMNNDGGLFANPMILLSDLPDITHRRYKISI